MPGQPMRVRDLAENGVTAVKITCVCGRVTTRSTENLPTDLTMMGLARRLRCQTCDEYAKSVEPDWSTRKAGR